MIDAESMLSSAPVLEAAQISKVFFRIPPSYQRQKRYGISDWIRSPFLIGKFITTGFHVYHFIEMPNCDNDIHHLLLKCPIKPNITYSFRDDTLIMAFIRSGLGVTISQELVLQAFGCPGVISRLLELVYHRTLGLAFSKTVNSVVSRALLEYLQNEKR